MYTREGGVVCKTTRLALNRGSIISPGIMNVYRAEFWGRGNILEDLFHKKLAITAN